MSQTNEGLGFEFRNSRLCAGLCSVHWYCFFYTEIIIIIIKKQKDSVFSAQVESRCQVRIKQQNPKGTQHNPNHNPRRNPRYNPKNNRNQQKTEGQTQRGRRQWPCTRVDGADKKSEVRQEIFIINLKLRISHGIISNKKKTTQNLKHWKSGDQTEQTWPSWPLNLLFFSLSPSSRGEALGPRRKLYSAVPGRHFVVVRPYTAQAEGEINLYKSDRVKGESRHHMKTNKTVQLLTGLVDSSLVFPCRPDAYTPSAPPSDSWRLLRSFRTTLLLKHVTISTRSCGQFKSEVWQIHPEKLQSESRSISRSMSRPIRVCRGRKRRELEAAFSCDKYRKLPLASKQRRPQRGRRCVVGLLRTGQHFQMTRAENGAQDFSLLPTGFGKRLVQHHRGFGATSSLVAYTSRKFRDAYQVTSRKWRNREGICFECDGQNVRPIEFQVSSRGAFAFQTCPKCPFLFEKHWKASLCYPPDPLIVKKSDWPTLFSFQCC